MLRIASFVLKPVDPFSRESFEHTYKRCVKKLCAICFNVVSDREIATEIVHNVFLSVWERREVLILEGEMENYLVRAVKLAALEHIRTTMIHRKHLSGIASGQREETNTTEDQLAFHELNERITFIASCLPPQCREVFSLSREKGLSNKGVALSLHISEKTVEAHLSKALKYLKDHLRDYSL
ncbi:RNA polymerase sigma-70 factor [Dyadobacter pollutisoli]|jgi:RNA polymerase sigma-70 factor (ECF subfamily)|uniref:RNA polymerase sigma-70 factor n=1 Tax=Dyadobacter pollutisoli TaxID=2910158 RepID=A0A9E8NAM3_9BACT|nr:RNA polymerase sigma-70 factor [Dyadobacter pollutisoli]WAC13040.1 RNA polymerase sigma-70 factor [Dyadobacter pollutisoli]